MAQSRRDRQERAGAWLRQERLAAGFESGRSFADALDIDPSRISRYETGADAVPDEVAEKIAAVLHRDIIDVRAGLGLWVPPGDYTARSLTLEDFTDAQLLAEVNRRMTNPPEPQAGRRTA